MQASISASPEQIVWVLTSYLMAGAIATPLSGWLAGRYGRKKVMMFSVAGFTIASVLCGSAKGLGLLVAARAVQGACGASLIPLSLAILLDINPPEGYARAVAIFSIGSMTGPLIGPTLGGWLTDTLSWRWVFFINAPIGILSFSLMLASLDENRNSDPPKFDMFGFLTVSAALAAFQLMLDRGEQLDWFESTEICVYAVILCVAVYLAAVHMLTARNTFLRTELFRNRNFAIGCTIGLALGIVYFATVPLVVVMTQSVLGYTAFRTGMVGMPRAIGTLIGITLVSRLTTKVDSRLLLAIGLVSCAVAMLWYSRMDIYVDERSLVIAGVFQGLAGGLMFVPLQTIVFATLSPGLRNEGAATNALIRNIGNAVGISFLQRELIHYTAQAKSGLVEGIRPDNVNLQYSMPDFDFASIEALARIDRDIVHQASMVGNIELYALIVIISVALLPLVLLMRGAGKTPADSTLHIVE